jgi:EF hand
MKHKTLITTGLLLGASLFASAQDPGPKRPPGGKLPPAILKEFDKDGDGKLSDEERKAMREAMEARMKERRKEMLEKYDADGDGKLSEEEIAKARADRQAEILKKYDKDGDGKLSEEERAAIPPSERGPGHRGGGPGGRRGPGAPDGQGAPGGPPPAVE